MPREGRDGAFAGIGIDAVHDDPLGVVVSRGDESLRQHERCGRGNARRAPHLAHHVPPVVEPQSLTVGEHADVRIRDQDLVSQVLLEPVHHAEHHHERHDPHGHPTDGDDRNEREQARRPPAAEVAQRKPEIERRGPVRGHDDDGDERGDAQQALEECDGVTVHSGRSMGNRMTSRIWD